MEKQKGFPNLYNYDIILILVVKGNIMRIEGTPYSLKRHQVGFEVMEDCVAFGQPSRTWIGYFDTPRQLYEYLELCLKETECKADRTSRNSPAMHYPVIHFRPQFKEFIKNKPFISLSNIDP